MSKKTKVVLFFVFIVAFFYGGSAVQAADVDLGSGNPEYTWLIEPKYEDAGRFSRGLWPVKKDGLWGYVDSADNVVIDFQYLSAEPFEKWYASVKVSRDIRAVIDMQGQYLIQPSSMLESAYSRGEGAELARFRNPENRYGYLNLSGDVQIPAIYNWGSFFSEGTALVKSHDHEGIIDADGNWVVFPRYKILSSVWRGYIPFKSDVNLWGIMNLKEEVLIEPQYTSIEYMGGSELLKVEIDGKYGFLDDRLVAVIAPQYVFDKFFSVTSLRLNRGDLVFVYDSGKFMALDNRGEMAFQFPAMLARPFTSYNVKGYYVLVAGSGRGYFLVGRRGEVLLPPKFRMIKPSAEGIIAAQQESRYGLLRLGTD